MRPTTGRRPPSNPTGTPDTAWAANGPQVPGTHFIISITDSASAARYGLQTASLSRSGDDGADRTLRRPDPGEPPRRRAVRRAQRGARGAGARPLDHGGRRLSADPAVVRGGRARDPDRRPSASCTPNFILYAIGDGQTSGVEPGELPPGYVPLPGDLRLEALNATNAILHPPAEPAATTTTPGSSDDAFTGSSPTTSAHGVQR